MIHKRHVIRYFKDSGTYYRIVEEYDIVTLNNRSAEQQNRELFIEVKKSNRWSFYEELGESLDAAEVPR